MKKIFTILLMLIITVMAGTPVATYFNTIKSIQIIGLFKNKVLIKMDNGRVGELPVKCFPEIGDTIVTYKYFDNANAKGDTLYFFESKFLHRNDITCDPEWN